MNPQVSIIMGSLSDMPVMEEAARFLEQMEIPFEINALSAHRTPDKVADFARNASQRGVRVIIAGAGGAAHLPGVIAAYADIPVIGVPVKSSNSLAGLDSILSILQMPAGIPVATMALDGARNAAIFAAGILALGNQELAARMKDFRSSLTRKVEDVKSSNSLAGLDSILSILQMPAGIPVATMALDGARNAAIFAAGILALGNQELAARMKDFRSSLTRKVEEANESIKKIQYRYKI